MSAVSSSRLAILAWCTTLVVSLWLAWAPDLPLHSALFLLMAAAVQATLLSAPVLLLHQWVRIRGRRHLSVRWQVVAMYLGTVALLLFLIANYKLMQMYGFYVNFFVLNLLTTPGGVEAMGVSSSTNATLAVLVFLIAVLTWLAVRWLPMERLWPTRVRTIHCASAFVVLLVTQALWYAWSEYRYDRAVLQTADRIIWYIPVTARTFLEDMGVEIQRPDNADMEMAGVGGRIDYPPAPQQKFTRPLNVVWLVAESWRADMLTRQIMPNTFAFAQKTHQFRQHYSGGNGTRMGMFSQFYGLYGSYWFDFLNEGRSPVLMDMLQNNGYDMKAFTSSRFSYPEFDKTIFAGLEDEQLQSFSEGPAWQRDRKNVGDMIAFIDQAKAPFFSFMFFESAHANYYFPDEDIIAPDYIEDFNYLTVDIEENIERIRARYINANHHLDSQLGRVFKALEEQGRLEDTIVIVTGDHGEEFMENGRWGHNSTFSQEQIRVPLLVFVPGSAPSSTEIMTSHLDLPATVLSALGVTVDPQTYSYGSDLLGRNYQRNYTVVSDWHGNTLVTPELKLVFSKKGAAYDDTVTNLDDDPVDLSQAGSGYRTQLGLFARELSRFYK